MLAKEATQAFVYTKTKDRLSQIQSDIWNKTTLNIKTASFFHWKPQRKFYSLFWFHPQHSYKAFSFFHHSLVTYLFLYLFISFIQLDSYWRNSKLEHDQLTSVTCDWCVTFVTHQRLMCNVCSGNHLIKGCLFATCSIQINIRYLFSRSNPVSGWIGFYLRCRLNMLST